MREFLDVSGLGNLCFPEMGGGMNVGGVPGLRGVKSPSIEFSESSNSAERRVISLPKITRVKSLMGQRPDPSGPGSGSGGAGHDIRRGNANGP